METAAERRRTGALKLHLPARAELAFRQSLLADEETMAYNHAWGGVISFPEEDWDDWYDRWIAKPDGRRYYRYLQDAEAGFVGEIAWHLDPETGWALANVLIHAQYRGRGFGSRGLELLCAAAKEQGLSALYDDIAADNPARPLFLRHGFQEIARTEEKIILKREL